MLDPYRKSIHSKLVILAPIVLLLIAIGYFPGRKVYEFHRYFSAVHQGRAEILGLESLRPQQIPSTNWDELVGWAVTSFSNITDGPGAVPQETIELFTSDLRQKKQEGVDEETIVWLFRRLACMHPRGNDYVSKYWNQIVIFLPEESKCDFEQLVEDCGS